VQTSSLLQIQITSAYTTDVLRTAGNDILLRLTSPVFSHHDSANGMNCLLQYMEFPGRSSISYFEKNNQILTRFRLFKKWYTDIIPTCMWVLCCVCCYSIHLSLDSVRNPNGAWKLL